MSNLSTIPGFSVGGGGGGGGGLPSASNILTLIDEVTYTPDASQTSALAAERNMCIQSNATDFAFCTMGRNQGANQMGIWAQPFKISDANGSITLGTPNGIRNSSGTAISTTTKGYAGYDRAVWFGRQHWSGSYEIMCWGCRLTSANTVVLGRDRTGNDYNSSGYGHPQGAQISGGPNTVYFSVYFSWNNSYSGWLRYGWNGNSHYTYQTYSILNSYSSTQHTYQAMDHYTNNNTVFNGVVLDHRDNPNGFYYTEIRDGSTYGLGYGITGLWGQQVYSQNQLYKMSSGNVIYSNWQANAYFVTNGQGTIIKSKTSTDMWNLIGRATGAVGTLTISLGNDYFIGPSKTNLGWIIYKLQLDASYNLTVTPISYIFTDDGVSSPTNNSQNSTMWRLAGNQQQYLVEVTSSSVKVYNSTPIKSLMTL